MHFEKGLDEVWDVCAVEFLLPREKHMLRLVVGQHSPSEALVPDVQLIVQEGSDVTFQPGADVELNVISTIDASPGDVALSSADIVPQMFVRSQSEENTVVEDNSVLQLMGVRHGPGGDNSAVNVDCYV